jgi:hypothetical protein
MQTALRHPALGGQSASVQHRLQVPRQQRRASGPQSLLVQHWLFGMQLPSQTFCPPGQLDAQRPLAQT